MKKLLCVSIVAISMSSCAVHNNGYMLNSASLSSANFSYVKENISGSAVAMSILGIGGGLFKESLVNEAKQKMLSSYPLKDNQALVNITINYKTAIGGILFSKTCTITADVVQFKTSETKKTLKISDL